MRREIARLSLHRLVQDGRIHPARIEEVVAKVNEDFDERVLEHGNDAAYSMPDVAHRKNPHTEMPYFNTRAFFKVLRGEVTKRLEEMLEAEGLAI